MMKLIWVWSFILHIAVYRGACEAGGNKDAGFVFIVLSQDSVMSSWAADRLSTSIADQARQLGMVPPVVYLAHQQWPDVVGTWTVFPLLPRLDKLHRDREGWFFFCDESTGVDLELLHNAVRGRASTKKHFIGHALWDQEPTIIHHFEDARSLAYPDISAGMLLSKAAVECAAQVAQRASLNDFSIDRQYEIAKYLEKYCGDLLLEHVEAFCLGERREGCATWTPMQAPSCSPRIPADSLTVAVKTCERHHEQRVPLIKATWAGAGSRVVFFSDVEDPRIPTLSVGVGNVERGHCAKTMAILKLVLLHGLMDSWLVIADDDTLISIPRLLDLLSCLDPQDDLALGERYGFAVASEMGYDYLTGGSGMVFSRTVVEKILRSECSCPAADSPDDMILGACLKMIGIPVTHSPLFHQARPEDYSQELLSHQRPISFHKFWMTDPVANYKKWLVDSPSNSSKHDEL